MVLLHGFIHNMECDIAKKNIKKLTSMYNLTYIDKKNSHILSFTKL